jgi:glyoxylase-like metal-dependent hydrolase (beta-lactamase superfamily II)/rhodanese-related sulfurtransferase
MTAPTGEWTVARLNNALHSGEDIFILDIRNRDEAEAAPVEGTKPLRSINVPYFEMLESSESFDFVESVKEAHDRGLMEGMPRDEPILAVCAKGDTSDFVVDALRPLGYDIRHLGGGTLAWGNHYELRTVAEEDKLAVYQIQRLARGCLSHVVVSDGRGVVIDPLRHIDQYSELAEAENFEITAVLDTHGHADHISGGRTLADWLKVPYFLHPYDGIHPLDVLPAEMDYEFLKEGWELAVGGATIRAMHVPGHTLGNIVFYLDDRFLFTGDSIFIRSIARPDLGGKGETWAPIHYRSLSRLLELPDETLIMPGHFSGRTEANDAGQFAAPLGELKETNDGLQMVHKGEEPFVQYILESLPKFPDEYVEIKRVNAGLLEPDEDEASELELGKNICALSQAYGLVGAGAEARV